MQQTLDYFKANVVFDDEQICHKQMQTRFKELFGKFKRVCDKNSEVRCYDVLNRLNMKIVQKLKGNVYAKESGYDEYIDDINMLVKRYDGTCGLGTQSRRVLQTFLDGKAGEEEIVHKLVLEATGKVEASESTAPKATRKSVQRSDSHHETMIQEIKQLEHQVCAEFQKKEDVSYEQIKLKYLDKMAVQLQEIDRQIQEGCVENVKALENERSFLVKLIDTSKKMDDLTDKSKKELHAKPLRTNRASLTNEQNTEERTGTLYEVPWEFRPSPIGGESTFDFNENTPGMIRRCEPVKPVCSIQ